MKRIRSFIRDQRALSAVEFGLIAPVFASFVIGTTQLGTLFYANADMRNAVATGARAASVWPVPDKATVKAAVEEHLVRRGVEEGANVTVADPANDSNGNPYIEIGITYDVPLNLLFFAPDVTLSDTRRVMLQRGYVRPASDLDTPTPTPPSPTPPSPPPPSPGEPSPPSPPPSSPPPSSPPPPPPPAPVDDHPGKGKDDDKHEDHGTCTKKCK